MQDKNKDDGKELIDMDENGNVNDKKEEKKNKTSENYKYIILVILLLLLGFICFFCFYTKSKRSAFDKTKLKNLKLKNRFFYGAEHDAAFSNGKFTEKAFKKIESIAQKDVSFFITGGAIVGDIDKTRIGGKELLRLDKDDFIEEHKKFVDHAHNNNLYIIVQLGHLGLMSGEDIIYSPSVNKAFFEDRNSVEMTKEDIQRVENDYAQAAIRAKKAGYDGINIQEGHLGLPELFLSRKYNRRTDEYGGSFENRSRFIIEIIRKVREAVGNNILLTLKLDSEGIEDTVDEKEFYILGKMAEEAGIDLIEVSGNNYRQKKGDDLLYYNATKKLLKWLKFLLP